MLKTICGVKWARADCLFCFDGAERLAVLVATRTNALRRRAIFGKVPSPNSRVSGRLDAFQARSALNRVKGKIMKMLRYRAALLATLAMLMQPGCGGRGELQDRDQSVAGTAGFNCQPGDTRECVGPAACRGGQQCRADGLWGTCDCGTQGGTSSIEASGGNGTGGQGNGGLTSTGGMYPTGGWVGVGGTSSHPTGGWGGVGGTSSHPTGGWIGVGGTSSHPTGGWGGVGGTSSRPTGGTGPGGATYAGGTTAGGAGGTGGTASGGVATGGVRPTGGAPTGGVATGGTTSRPNRPPQITGLGFYPNPVTTNDTLTIYTEASDPDYDTITYTYAWTCNGKAVGSNSQQLSGELYFSKGDEIKVTVTPSDGKTYGDPATTQPIIVANAAPQFGTWPSLSPVPTAQDDDTLRCDASATDPDGDPIKYTYNWYNSNTLTSYHDSTLPSAATSMNDVWTCEVLASDGSSSVSAGQSATTNIVTTVSGIYRTDTTWQASKSPYIVTGRIQIAAGVTLKIEPGVTVIGNGYSIEFWGSIQAAGTADNPILIRDLWTYDYSTVDKPGKFTLAFAEYVGGTLLGNGNAALVNVSDCVLRGLLNPISLAPGLSVAHRFERNLFSTSCGIYANGPLVLNSNTFAYTTQGYYDLVLQDSLDASSNDFYPNTDIVVMAGAKSVDLHNSYWGGIADTDIPALILDNNDDLTILGEVTYLPTLKDPSPTAPPSDKTYFP